MAWVYALQLLMPVALVLWMLAAPPRNRIGWAAQLGASLLVLGALGRVGIWMFPPWWTVHASAALLVAIAVWGLLGRAPTARWPLGAPGWLALAFATILGITGLVSGWRALAGARPPDQPAAALAWPLRGATFLVANGGNDALINAHLESMVSPDPRFVPWRGNGWAVDFVAIDSGGLRARGFMPEDPARYVIFGMPVLAPCAGTVVQAVDGLPDMRVPQYDRQHLAGNHVILACGDVHVALAHLQRGSVRAKAGETIAIGQPLGAVGNSGGSNEPHLHLQAQRPGAPGAPFGGAPLPVTFEGRFLVRGDRITRP